MTLSRRDAIKGAAASVALIACESVSPVVAQAVVPRQSCGCLRVHEIAFGHTCIVHDEKGRRWDSYTFEEIAALNHAEVQVQTQDTDWSCYCNKCSAGDELGDHVMLVGTKCVWEKTSYEYDEWECECAHSYRRSWLDAVTTDWIAMAKEDDSLHDEES